MYLLKQMLFGETQSEQRSGLDGTGFKWESDFFNKDNLFAGTIKYANFLTKLVYKPC